MAAFINGFISAGKPLESLAFEIETVLGIEPSDRDGAPSAFYGAACMGMDVGIFEGTGYEADKDIECPRTRLRSTPFR